MRKLGRFTDLFKTNFQPASLGFFGPENEVDLILSLAAVLTQPFVHCIAKTLVWVGGGDLLRGVECQRHHPIQS